MKFSANLGFLWADLALPEAIAAAAGAGFDAVECHWPYDVPADAIRAALEQAGLKMLGLNTRRGNVAAGEIGLAALPGRQAQARAAISEAVRYAGIIGAANVHVMAGRAEGGEAEAAFLENLGFACEIAAPEGITILIEALNRHDAPGYFLRSTDQAEALIAGLGAENLKLMFDCYHVARSEGDVTGRLERLLPIIGHIQFAGVPDRGPPDRGDLDYGEVFREIARLGYVAPLGAEYKPGGPTEASLGWMSVLR